MQKRSGNKLARWEVSIVKTMLTRGYPIQDVQSYFSRPSRSINHARIIEIRDGSKHKTIKHATEDELEAFLESYPNIDHSSGLNYRGDELLIKAREAMIAAVQLFNGGGLYFRSEIFLVTSIIAWTYLLHEYYRRLGIDYRYKTNGQIDRTKNGADKYWELTHCLASSYCPLEKGIVNNLRFLIEIRNEVEHRSTNRIDEYLSAKLQACCINFNSSIKKLFGKEHALEKRIPIALQFVTFDGAGRSGLLRQDLPAHIAATTENFEDTLTKEEQRDPHFRYKVAFVPIVTNRAKKADLAIEFVRPGSVELDKIERVLFKETEKRKFLPSEIVESIRSSGFPNFNMHDHSLLVRSSRSRNADAGYGVTVGKTWYWYESWFEFVIQKLHDGWTRPVKE